MPIPFPIDTLKQYLETKHGSVLRHGNKVDKMGFEMEAHHFGMRKDNLNEILSEAIFTLVVKNF